jgi:hypothetical protein
MMSRRSMRSFRVSGASEMPRVMEKKNVIRILAPYESA